MREILFRGKRQDNGEWIEGFYAKSGDKHFILIDNDFAIGYVKMKEVIPETVGQFTGLTDKNGKKIFEGDVVTQKDSSGYCLYGSGAIKYGAFNCSCCHAVYGFYVTNDGADLRTLQSEWGDGKEIEVIGNIHDNPELLEEI